MVKIITVRIPDKLVSRIEPWQSKFNVSEICRDALVSYVDQLEQGEPEWIHKNRPDRAKHNRIQDDAIGLRPLREREAHKIIAKLRVDNDKGWYYRPMLPYGKAGGNWYVIGVWDSASNLQGEVVDERVLDRLPLWQVRSRLRNNFLGYLGADK